MVDRALLTIDSVITPTGTATNIVSVREEFIMQNDPRFVPNTYEGVGMKFDHEWRQITIIFDSDTDIFDNYIDDDGPNIVIPTLTINFTMVNIGTQATQAEQWTYTNNKIWVMDRREGMIAEGSERQTFEYIILAYDDKTITIT